MSEELQAEALGYFQTPGNYFWRWAEELEVVEWQDGTTVGYREELLNILKGLADGEAALPPLGSVLLLLTGCNGWEDANGEMLWQQFRQYGEFLDASLPVTRIEATIKLMQQVAALPPALRTGLPKQHLFREVFGERTARSIEPARAAAVVDEWTSGRLDAALRTTGPASHWSDFTNDLRLLANASRRFAEPGSLELLLRTSLDQLPEPPPLPTPPAPEPPAPLDLFDQLARDPRTAGLARLAQHLAAALRIPLHSRGASDQPLGGVADVTNRGSFDRLLLSELAHDDISLVARLVNNEALYLRREEPPRQDARPRFILLDTTLRMWGVPRVFALAAALAWVRNARQARPPLAVAAVALGGKEFAALDLESFEGVVAALELLDAAPHGGVALQAFARLAHQLPTADTLLITEAQLLHQPEFAGALAQARPALRFLLTVDRSGELQLYEYQNGHRAPLSAARYDLDELLFKASAPPHRPPPISVSGITPPAFMQQRPAPLYFPTVGMKVLTSNTYFPGLPGVLGITDKQRVLHWPNPRCGAREILPVIEEGSYSFGSEGQTYYVLVSGKGQLIFYALTADTGAVIRLDLSAEVPADTVPATFAYHSGKFYLRLPNQPTDPRTLPVSGMKVFDCKRQQLVAHGSNTWPYNHSASLNHQHAKQFINNGYNVLQRVARLGLNDAGELLIGGHELRLVSVGYALTPELHLESKRPESRPRALARISVETFPLTANERLEFRLFRWANGSEAVLDPRGLLHLRSAEASVPEITLVLVLNQPTAAWAADGTVSGSTYFTGPNPSRQLTVPGFYQQYIQRFIEHLA